jgi:S1-C subfamily serine protease
MDGIQAMLASNGLADVVERVAPSVVQVQGGRRPASGVVYGNGIVVTTIRALGREDGLSIRAHDGAVFDAELAGWDAATTLAVVRVPNLSLSALEPAADAPRVGHLALAVARSWSNSVTASAGIVSVIGGPLPTGRGRAIDQVLRTTAPMHSGFAGGGFVDLAGRLTGITTDAAIRGLGVVIPAPIAWKTAAALLEHGSLKRGYLGLAGQSVQLPESQRPTTEGRALLVVGVTPDSPAEHAGLLVGDLLLAFDGEPVSAPDSLLDLLHGDRVGRAVPVKVRRGTSLLDLTVTVGERPRRR